MSKAYWQCADGRKLRISEMSDLHVFNSLKMLFRRLNLPYEEMPTDVLTARRYLINYTNRKAAARDKASINRNFGGPSITDIALRLVQWDNYPTYREHHH